MATGHFELEYNETEHILTVHGEIVDHTGKLGVSSETNPFWMQVLIFGSCIPAAVLLVCGIFYLSRRHEQERDERLQEKKRAVIDELLPHLEAKPWSSPVVVRKLNATNASTLNAGSVTTPRMSSLKATVGPFSSIKNPRGNRRSLVSSMLFPEPPESRADFKDYHNGYYCGVCLKAFQVGNTVYRSNYHLCKHVHHDSCMHDHLFIENSCPICKHSFVVKPGHELGAPKEEAA